MYAGHLDLGQPLVWTVEEALPPELCRHYIERLRSGDAVIAPIVGGVQPEVRNNTRIMWDDAAEADGLLARVIDQVPDRLMGLPRAGANPRLRIYRYERGQRHGAHWDTVVELDGGICSLLTLVFYLNEDFTGGDTDFPELRERIVPRTGRALLFQHRILHEAMEVTSGEKFVLRTDVLYGPGEPGGDARVIAAG